MGVNDCKKQIGRVSWRYALVIERNVFVCLFPQKAWSRNSRCLTVRKACLIWSKLKSSTWRQHESDPPSYNNVFLGIILCPHRYRNHEVSSGYFPKGWGIKIKMKVPCLSVNTYLQESHMPSDLPCSAHSLVKYDINKVHRCWFLLPSYHIKQGNV